MPRPTHPKLTKLDILEYAHTGVVKRLTETHPKDWGTLNAHAKEIRRRIKLVEIATARKEKQS